MDRVRERRGRSATWATRARFDDIGTTFRSCRRPTGAGYVAPIGVTKAGYSSVFQFRPSFRQENSRQSGADIVNESCWNASSCMPGFGIHVDVREMAFTTGC